MQFGLVLFDYHHVLAIPVNDSLGNIALREERIHREDAARYYEPNQDIRHGTNLIGIVLYPQLGEDETQTMTQGCQQMGMASTLFATATHRFAIHSDRIHLILISLAWMLPLLFDPLAYLGFKLLNQGKA